MSTMNPCPDWRELLSAYHDQQLTKKEARRVEEHLAGCADCREAMVQWDADRARFTAAYAESTGGLDLRTAVLEEIRTMKPLHTVISLPLRKFRWLLGLSSVAVAGCIMLGGMLALKMDFTNELAIKPQAQNERVVATAAPIPANPSEQRVLKMPEKPVTIVVNRLRPMSDAYDDSPEAAAAVKKAMSAYHDVKLKPDAFAGNRLTVNKPYDVPATPADATSSVNGPALNRNYGVAGGVHMSYNVDYQVEVKEALKGARQAQEMVRTQGGFTVDFQFNSSEGEIPTASFRGKIPADKADSVLAEFEKLGHVRVANVDGEDLTWQYRELENRMKYETGSAKAETKRQYAELGLKENLVEFTASFVEPKPRERTTLATVARTTKDVLKYALLAVATLAVILLGLMLLISPVMIIRKLRRKAKAEREMPEVSEAQVV